MEGLTGLEPAKVSCLEGRRASQLRYNPKILVPQVGLEPTRCRHHGILSPVRAANFATGAAKQDPKIKLLTPNGSSKIRT